MFKDYFHFTRSERNGVIALFVLIGFFIFAPKLYSMFFYNQIKIDYKQISTLIAQSDSLRPKQDSVELFVFNPNTVTKANLIKLGLSEKVAKTVLNYRNKVGNFSKKEDFKRIWGVTEADYARLEPYMNLSQEVQESMGFADKVETKLFDFDPNFATKEELLQLGLSEKVVTTLINFREKGGKFFKKEDLKKIYGIKEADYQRLESHIITNPFASNEIPKTYDNTLIIIDVNTAAIEDFKQLRGIGEKTADRIIRFRNALGGFHCIEQVGETWGLPKDVFANLKPQFIISPGLEKINLNTATVDELKAHPYLKWREANTIVEYRNQHGSYVNVADIRKIEIINGELYVKIEPYLTVE